MITRLTSPKTIIILILLTLTACTIGFFVPQITDMNPSFFDTWQKENIYTYRFVTRLQLHHVYTSYWFLTLVTLMALSLFISLYQQIKRNISKGLEQSMHFSGRELQGLDSIKNVLKKKRFREKGFLANSHKLIFSKNSIGRWGGVVLHAGLLLVVVSAILVACFQKRGFLQLIEGDTFDGRPDSFLSETKGVLAGAHNIGFTTYLSKLDHLYWNTGKLKRIESSLSIGKEGKSIEKTISINSPLSINGVKIYQSGDYGYSLSFALNTNNGEKIISHFNIDRAPDVRKFASGTSDFPFSPYIFTMKFIPDLDKKTYYFNKPIVHLNVSEGLNTVFSGLVIPGTAVKIKDDILHFTGVRYWSGLIYVENPGISIAYIGFAIVVIGIATMFLLPYKEIHVRLTDREVVDEHKPRYTIQGHTRRYQALFKEEVDEIRKEVGSLNNG